MMWNTLTYLITSIITVNNSITERPTSEKSGIKIFRKFHVCILSGISCVYIIWNFMCVYYLEFHVCKLSGISCVYIIWNFMCVYYLEFHVCILFGIDLKNHPVTCFRMLQVGDRFSKKGSTLSYQKF